MTVVTVVIVTVVIVTIVTVLIMTVMTIAEVTVVILTYFSKNNLTHRQSMRCSQGSVLRFSLCFLPNWLRLFKGPKRHFKYHCVSFMGEKGWGIV